jgi:hypothetical protein
MPSFVSATMRLAGLLSVAALSLAMASPASAGATVGRFT